MEMVRKIGIGTIYIVTNNIIHMLKEIPYQNCPITQKIPTIMGVLNAYNIIHKGKHITEHDTIS